MKERITSEMKLMSTKPRAVKDRDKASWRRNTQRSDDEEEEEEKAAFVFSLSAAALVSLFNVFLHVGE